MFDIQINSFGALPDGREAQLYTLTNPVGMRVCITNYGGIVTQCWVPDSNGELTVDVVYRLTCDNTLVTDYKATTTAPAPVNLTQHSYFNLAGGGSVESHSLSINADYFTPVNDVLIPTGELAPVKGSAFDFTEAKPIGRDVRDDHPQLAIAGGYDHNFVLSKHHKADFVLAAEALEPESGRVLKVSTTEPGVQFYSGNFLDGSLSGKGQVYQKHAGFFLERQHFPDAPNQEGFDDITLRPGETYRSTMSFNFTTV